MTAHGKAKPFRTAGRQSRKMFLRNSLKKSRKGWSERLPFRKESRKADYILSGTAIPSVARAEDNLRRVMSAATISTARLVSSSSAIIRWR
jgi:hypothetical protein